MNPREAQIPTQAIQTLTERLIQAVRSVPAKDRAGVRLVRAEAPVIACPPLDWLRAHPERTQYYWSDRGGAFEVAGVGEADILAPTGPVNLEGVFAHMRARLPRHQPSLRYYGGFRFDLEPRSDERWKDFKDYRFVAPRIEVVRRAGGLFLACNLKLQHPSDDQQALGEALADLASVRFPVEAPPPLPVVATDRRDRPNHAEWVRLVEEALDALARGDFEKVVLARETSFTSPQPLDAASLLSQLVSRETRSFEFCFHPAPDRAFIGASPERLFRRVNVHLESEALAGTRGRGKTDEEDRRLGQELLGSNKDLLEHRYVVRTLREHFRRFCEVTQMDEAPSLVRLRHCQHLYTRIEGLLKSPDVDAQLIETLHPTPAVGGVPRKPALDWIRAHEPFDRGIYAAPVGWVGFDAAEFCVGIRCGLVQDGVLTLYNGAGIVRGSVPEEEWKEIENKMGGFIEILGHGAA